MNWKEDIYCPLKALQLPQVYKALSLFMLFKYKAVALRDFSFSELSSPPLCSFLRLKLKPELEDKEEEWYSIIPRHFCCFSRLSSAKPNMNG